MNNQQVHALKMCWISVYFGGDISDTALGKARRKNSQYSRMQFLPQINILNEVPQLEDAKNSLYLFKHVIQHMPLKDGQRALTNIKKTGIRYLAITQHDPKVYHTTGNKNIPMGGWWPNNMYAAPFNWRNPVADSDTGLNTDKEKLFHQTLLIFDLTDQPI